MASRPVHAARRRADRHRHDRHAGRAVRSSSRRDAQPVPRPVARAGFSRRAARALARGDAAPVRAYRLPCACFRYLSARCVADPARCGLHDALAAAVQDAPRRQGRDPRRRASRRAARAVRRPADDAGRRASRRARRRARTGDGGRVMDNTVDFPHRPGRNDLPPLPGQLSPMLRRRRLLTHIGAIAAPVIVALLYLGFNAADRYEVTSEFTVQPLLPASGGNPLARDAAHLGNLAQNAAPGAYQAYMVVEYLKSPDALDTLERKIGFFDRYRGKTRDLFYRAEPWRFVFGGGSIPFEDRLAYYNRMVQPRYSITENIVTLDVQAFAPEDARLISAALLEMGEAFINRANERVLNDLVHGAETQVRADEARLNDDHRRMQVWRGA